MFYSHSNTVTILWPVRDLAHDQLCHVAKCGYVAILLLDFNVHCVFL